MPSEFANGAWSSSESADVIYFGLFLASKLELVFVLVSVVGGVGVECRSAGGVLV